MIKLLENKDLTDYTFIVPTVSVGNVAQLAVDLLINTLQLKKLGYVWHSSILPLASNDPFGNANSLSTGCELFYSDSLKVIALQIRSAFAKTKNDFIQSLCDWIKNVRLNRVVILTGSSAHERRDKQLIGEPLRYVYCPLTKVEEEKNAASRKWIQLESKTDLATDEDNIPSYIPGSGIALKLFQNCIREKIKCSILIEFCSDGNNIPDAVLLADYLDDWLHLKEKASKNSWQYPPSWILLFGPAPPTEIFN